MQSREAGQIDEQTVFQSSARESRARLFEPNTEDGNVMDETMMSRGSGLGESNGEFEGST